MADLKDILSENPDKRDFEELLKSQSEETSKNNPHFNQKLAEDLFEREALEGLKQINNPDVITKHVKQLNKKLYQQLQVSKKRADKRSIKDIYWIILAVIISLFVCIAGYFIIHIQKQNKAVNSSGYIGENKVTCKSSFHI